MTLALDRVENNKEDTTNKSIMEELWEDIYVGLSRAKIFASTHLGEPMSSNSPGVRLKSPTITKGHPRDLKTKAKCIRRATFRSPNFSPAKR